MTPTTVEEALFGKYKFWEQLKPTSWAQFSNLIEDLMGKNVEVRREYLFNKIDFSKITFL